MSDADPEVIQGRLGWEPGDVSEADPQNLEPHPKNTEIYGDTEDADDLDSSFKQSVAEKGVLEPLVITNGKQIISGHRRRLAAKAAGLDSVPVRYTEFDGDLAEREALVEFNRQREKTPGQIVNEFEEMVAVEKARAKERQSEYHGNQHERTSANVCNSADGDGSARDKAAEKIDADVSGWTLEKGLDVKEKADEGDETAQEEWEKLKDGEQSFHGAYTTVNDTDDEDADADQDDADGSSDISQFTSQETDEWSSPCELVEPLDDAVGGFDLDPCSGAESSPFAAEVYTESDDGLVQPWHGTVWVNPPYSEMDDWTTKAVAESDRDGVDAVYYLCKGDSSTDWWQDAATEATVIATIGHRLSFGDGQNSAPFASHIIVLGDVTDAAVSALRQHGVVLSRHRRGGDG